MSDLTRITEWTPAYNKVAEGFGRHGMELRFVLKGEKGAVQFVLYTGIYTSQDRDAYERHGGILGIDGRRHGPHPAIMAHGADLGYHALEPDYDGQTVREDCPYLDGRPCYYDGSTLNAEDPFDIFTDQGEEALWTFLEQYYRFMFEGAPAPAELGRRWKRSVEGSFSV